MRRPWPWYQISWSETHQAADTPPFLPGKKWSHHSPVKFQTHNPLQKCCSSFQCFVFSQCVCFCLCEMQMKKKNKLWWMPNFKTFLSSMLLLLNHKTSVAELLASSHYVEILIKSGRHICFIDMWLFRKYNWNGLLVQWAGLWQQKEWLITEVFCCRLTNDRQVAGVKPGRWVNSIYIQATAGWLILDNP